MSTIYTEIAKIEHVDGFDPKIGYNTYSKDGKGYTCVGNTLLEYEETFLLWGK